jgi:PTH2 family peptidyl-tRNA hydrolase
MNHYSVKQVILVRQDISMPKGKMAAQVAHASMAVITSRIHETPHQSFAFMMDGGLQHQYMEHWVNNSFTKVCLKVPTLEELQLLLEAAERANIPTSIICDNGTTVFNEPTITCGAIGPYDSETIDKITAHLKLL